MDNLKEIIADNISKLRQANGITQLELAGRLNYSDKAVSKWERGESIPDVTVLCEISQMFGVSLDFLVTEHDAISEIPKAPDEKHRLKQRCLITGMSIMLVWLIATFFFVIIRTVAPTSNWGWISFIYAIPSSMIVWLVMNSIWFNKKRNYIIISFLMWAILLSVWITFFICGFNFWMLFLLGIPGQIIILMWSNLNVRKHN